MPASQRWTILRLLTWTTSFLQRHGSESPRLDAEVLLAAVRRCQRIELYTAYDQVADAELLARYRELVRRRADGEPVAYLVGHREFFSLDFEVTPAVLIPRPETEFLIIELLDLAKHMGQADAAWSIADIGTGSGILAVCAARHLPAARIWAGDVSREALQVAARNCQRHDVDDRVQLAAGNLFDSCPTEVGPFDFILSNPPYVRSDEFSALDRTVREFEPRTALVAGPEGTEVIEPLLRQAAGRLRPGGWLLLEISPTIVDAVVQLVAGEDRFGQPKVVPDLAGHPRIVKVARAG